VREPPLLWGIEADMRAMFFTSLVVFITIIGLTHH
jgi:hypothetical protein